MTNLFQLGNFKSHSGEPLRWKINCDVLTIQDWECLASMIAVKIGMFGKLEGVPKGGLALVEALKFHRYRSGPLLIVDDVLTTGKVWKNNELGEMLSVQLCSQEALARVG